MVGCVQHLLQPSPHRLNEEITHAGSSSSEDDSLRIEDVHHVRQSDSDPPTEFVEDVQGLGVSSESQIGDVLTPNLLDRTRLSHQVVAIADFDCSAGQQSESTSGGISLPAATATAGTRRTCRIDEHVAEFPRESIRSAQQSTIGDDACTNTGTDRDQKEVLTVRSRTFSPFGNSCAGCIVVDPHFSPQTILEDPLRVEFDDIDQVGRSAEHARTCDETRQTDPHIPGRFPRNSDPTCFFFDFHREVDNRVEQQRTAGRSRALRTQYVGTTEVENGKTLRSADIDPDDRRVELIV